MDRRAFLRAVGAVALTGLAACGEDGEEAAGGESGGDGQEFDPVGTVAPDAEEELSVVSGSFEQLTGEQRPFAFGVLGPGNEPVTDADVELWTLPVEGGDPAGPYTTSFHEVAGNPFGLYVATIDLPAAGATSFVAVTADGRAGADTLQVSRPEDSQLPAPGQEAVAVPTATNADPRGVEAVCTREPPCGMHQVDLATALDQGLPVVLEFATPAYCQTAVCGPSVDTLEEVRVGRDWGEVTFIHVEVFRDAGQTLAEPLEAWGLPSEPWLYVIDGDGMIVNRADGPLLTLPDQVTAMVEEVA